MDRSHIIDSLREINSERVSIDPKIQLSALYREIRELLGAVSTLEKRLEQLNKLDRERQEELDQLLLDKPTWASKIESAKEMMIRSRGMTLKEMLGIQQEVVRLEESLAFADTKMNELQNREIRYEDNRKKMVSKLNELKAQYNLRAEIYNTEKGKADVILADIADRENKLLAMLTPEDGAVYREALRTNPESPVAMLEGEICSGCRIGLSKQLVKKVNQDGRLMFCENCMRILMPTQD